MTFRHGYTSHHIAAGNFRVKHTGYEAASKTLEPTAIYKTVANICARFGLVMAVAMLLPAAIDLRDGSDDWLIFVRSAAATGALSALILFATQNQNTRFTPRLGFC